MGSLHQCQQGLSDQGEVNQYNGRPRMEGEFSGRSGVPCTSVLCDECSQWTESATNAIELNAGKREVCHMTERFDDNIGPEVCSKFDHDNRWELYTMQDWKTRDVIDAHVTQTGLCLTPAGRHDHGQLILKESCTATNWTVSRSRHDLFIGLYRWYISRRCTTTYG